jgi:hypothetical protein
MYYYRSSHTILITNLFDMYHTHLVKPNSLCSYSSSQTVCPSDLYVVYHTHIDLGNHLCFLAHRK